VKTPLLHGNDYLFTVSTSAAILSIFCVMQFINPGSINELYYPAIHEPRGNQYEAAQFNSALGMQGNPNEVAFLFLFGLLATLMLRFQKVKRSRFIESMGLRVSNWRARFCSC